MEKLRNRIMAEQETAILWQSEWLGAVYFKYVTISVLWTYKENLLYNKDHINS